jgi:Flp pilus assembly protein TadG
VSMIRSAARRRHVEGQTLVVFALFLVVLLGATGIAVDYGSWLKVRRDYQNVADAAVLAGSVHLVRPITFAKQADARKAAWKSIEDQLGLTLDEATLSLSDTPTGPGTGYLDVATGFRIWVSTPPLGPTTAYTGAFAGSNRVLFAWVEKDNPSFFSRILGIGDQKVSAWATAGTFPNRFAVITLRKNGQPTNGNPTDLDINGGTKLNVVDGDVGGNWGMSVNGGTSQVRMTSSTGDTYGIYLTENVPTGGNGWVPSQVVNGSGIAIPVQYSAEVTDPNYPAPCLTYTGGGSCLVDRAVGAFPPDATTARVGDTCPYNTTTNVDRLPAGRYDDIKVPNNKCLVLDPTFNPVTGKENGIFYITGTLDINNGGLVIGDGVTLIFDRNAGLNMNAGASISLNSGNTTNNPLAAACGGVVGGGTTNCRFGGWSAKAGAGGTYTWSLGTSPTFSIPGDPFERGLAAYVCKSAGAANCGSGGSPSTNIFQMNSASGIDYRGMIYAPYDNVKVAGQPTHSDIGQLVAWTAQFTGGSTITQTYDGPDSAVPVLLEPRLGQ